MENTRRTNNDTFFHNPTGATKPPPPPLPPRAGNRVPQQHAASYYSNAPPPRPAATAPKPYPTSYSSNPSGIAPVAPILPPVQQQFQQQQPAGNVWFEAGGTTQSQQPVTTAPASNPSSEWYSNTPQTFQQPGTFSSVPVENTMSMPQQQTTPSQTPSNPSSLSGPMQPTSSSYKSSSSYAPSEFDDEPPLLEELGVNIPHIVAKSRAVILPVSRKTKEDEHLMDEDDLAGPLLFGLLLGGELLLSAKIHFGYIYGFGMFAWLAMSLILNLLSPPDAPISIWTVMSILGYSLLPVNILAAINIFIRMKNFKLVGFLLASFVIIWCTLSSTRLFEKLGLRDQRYLIAYPSMLIYSAFVILTIF